MVLVDFSEKWTWQRKKPHENASIGKYMGKYERDILKKRLEWKRGMRKGGWGNEEGRIGERGGKMREWGGRTGEWEDERMRGETEWYGEKEI